MNLARTKITDTGLMSVQYRLKELTFCILLGNKISPAVVATFLANHPGLYTLEYDNMREVLRILVDDHETNNEKINLRKIVLENCRDDMEHILTKSSNTFPLLEAFR